MLAKSKKIKSIGMPSIHHFYLQQIKNFVDQPKVKKEIVLSFFLVSVLTFVLLKTIKNLAISQPQQKYMLFLASSIVSAFVFSLFEKMIMKFQRDIKQLSYIDFTSYFEKVKIVFSVIISILGVGVLFVIDKNHSPYNYLQFYVGGVLLGYILSLLYFKYNFMEIKIEKQMVIHSSFTFSTKSQLYAEVKRNLIFFRRHQLIDFLFMLMLVIGLYFVFLKINLDQTIKLYLLMLGKYILLQTYFFALFVERDQKTFIQKNTLRNAAKISSQIILCLAVILPFVVLDFLLFYSYPQFLQIWSSSICVAIAVSSIFIMLKETYQYNKVLIAIHSFALLFLAVEYAFIFLAVLLIWYVPKFYKVMKNEY